jgi:serine/threonine protein kinase
MEALVLRCLAKDPADRPTNASALADGLLACEDAGSWTASDAAVWWREHGKVVEQRERPSKRRATVAVDLAAREA